MNADDAPTQLTKRYVALTEKLKGLPEYEEDEVEQIRDDLDKSWYAMTEQERDWLDGLE